VSVVSPHLVRAADLDGDRDLDLVATSHDTGTVHVWLGDGRGTFVEQPAARAVDVEKPHNHGLVAGDLDGNGTADVVVADQTGRMVVVLLADKQGRLVAGKPIALGGQAYPPELGDLNGDGKLDLVVPLVSEQAIQVLLGDGAGGFAVGAPHRTVCERPYGIAIGDINGDRKADVIATHDDTNDISVLLGDGKGGVAAAASSPISAGRRLFTPVLADLDADGALDLLGAGSQVLVVMRGDGRGAFAAPQTEPSSGWRAIAADLDGDKQLDILATEPRAHAIRVWMSSRAKPAARVQQRDPARMPILLE
jgi:hypothetical protein